MGYPEHRWDLGLEVPTPTASRRRNPELDRAANLMDQLELESGNRTVIQEGGERRQVSGPA